MKIQTHALILICLSGTLISSPTLYAGGDHCKPKSETSAALKPSRKASPETRINHLMGSDVRSKDGEVVGKIEEFLINPQSGLINFVIIGEEAGDGTVGRRVPLPWQAARIQDGRELVLNVDKQKFQGAPSSQQEDYSDLSSNQQRVLEIFRFFEMEPPSAMGAPGTESGVESGEAQEQTPRQEKVPMEHCPAPKSSEQR